MWIFPPILHLLFYCQQVEIRFCARKLCAVINTMSLTCGEQIPISPLEFVSIISVVHGRRISTASEPTGSVGLSRQGRKRLEMQKRKWKVGWSWRGRSKVEVVECVRKACGRLPILSLCFPMLFLSLVCTDAGMWVYVSCLNSTGSLLVTEYGQ